MDPWCFERRQELIQLAEDKGPVLIYNEEVLNEALFDLLSVQAVERIFQNVEVVRMPQVLRKIYEMGAGFRVNSADDVDHLRRLFPELDHGRMLFVPKGDRWEDYAYALDSGMQAVAWIQRLKHRADRIAEHSVLLGIPVKGDDLDDRYLETFFSAHLNGIYLEAEGTDFLDLKDMLPRLRERTSLVPLIVCLGGGVGLPIDSEKDRINTADLAEQVEDLSDACPGLRLWVEPGRYLVSHAGVLLTSVADAEAQNTVLEELRGPHHAVYALTRSDQGAQVALREVVNEDLKRSLSEMERDDILLVTNAGGLNIRAAWNHDALKAHYLKARRICQVRL